MDINLKKDPKLQTSLDMTSLDWREIYEERIAIATIDGKQSEAFAKILAREQVRDWKVKYESDRERIR